MTYVNVVFNLAIDKSFSYKIPSEILTEINVGQRVLAPFGKRELTGVVVNVSDKQPRVKCKDIIDVLVRRLRNTNKKVFSLFAWGLKAHGISDHL